MGWLLQCEKDHACLDESLFQIDANSTPVRPMKSMKPTPVDASVRKRRKSHATPTAINTHGNRSRPGSRLATPASIARDAVVYAEETQMQEQYDSDCSDGSEVVPDTPPRRRKSSYSTRYVNMLAMRCSWVY